MVFGVNSVLWIDGRGLRLFYDWISGHDVLSFFLWMGEAWGFAFFIAIHKAVMFV